MQLHDSSLHIVSANSQEKILPLLSESTLSNMSIFIAFLAGPCAVELTTSSVSLSPPLEPGAVRYSLIVAGTSVNLAIR